MIEKILSAGASVVVIGRNVWRHKKAAEFTYALVQMVHNGKKSREASAFLADSGNF